MTSKQLWFNFWAFVVAAMILVAALIALVFVIPRIAPEHRQFWSLIVAGQSLGAVLMGVGSVSNFRWGSIRFWPMTVASAGFFLTGWLLPFGIWGIVLWLRNRAYRAGLRRTP